MPGIVFCASVCAALSECLSGCISGNITDAFGLPVEMDVVLGGIQRDGSGSIVGAKIFQLALEIDTNWDAVDQASVDLGKSASLFTDDQLRGLVCTSRCGPCKDG